MLPEIIKQVPSAFRATRRGVSTTGNWRRQQLAIDVSNSLVDGVPVFLYCPRRNGKRFRELLTGFSHQGALQKRSLRAAEVEPWWSISKKTRNVAAGMRKRLFFR